MDCSNDFAVALWQRDWDAVLFDLDGVLTRTASVHAAAWKRLFDAFLDQHARDGGEAFIPFDIDADYRQYVDGKPRLDGVRSFLYSRGIDLPLGQPDDAPGADSVHALGELKDRYFKEELVQRGVERYEAAIDLVRSFRTHDIRTAVVSSSENCAAVLEAAGISHLFDARVDALELNRLGLEGKPAPAAFLEAARRLGAEPPRAIVVEDAISGVAAGRVGGFGYVIGVDRGGQSGALRTAGAHVVVHSLSRIRLAEEPDSAWSLVYKGFEPEREGIRESLCTLGNGYFETRGASVWSRADDIHYPGTYLAGGYNRLSTDIAGVVIENESLVNFPNWLALGFRVADSDWFDERSAKILSYRQELDLRCGVLRRTLRFEDGQGRQSTLTERRLVSMSDMHVGALELSLTAENWSATVTVRSAIEGRVVNSGASLYRKFNNQHLEPITEEALGDDCVFLEMRTRQSHLHVALAARTRALRNGEVARGLRRFATQPGYVEQELDIELERGQTLVLEKLAALHTSRDAAISECGAAARKTIRRAGSFQDVMSDHLLAWGHLWRRFDVHLEATDAAFSLNVPMLLRLHMLHLLQAVSPNSIGLDIGVPARGWTGEAYEGHIFWDELFIFPFLNYRTPEITRSLLLYRYRRLHEARAAARSAGFRGAMFPWQSGSDGQEETQQLNLNPRSQRWVPDNSHLQRHVGSAIAYNVWQYFQVTHDVEFLQFHGAELLLDIARFWSSIAHLNIERGRYEIHGVMGPDEYHEGYPDSSTPGLRNNAYTNIMAVWVLRRALDVLELLPEVRRSELAARLELSPDETARWSDIARKMFVPFHEDGVISQFEGYEALAELDWESYRKRYGNIQRLDLILEAEDDSANRYKLSKQADVLMLFYLFSAEELGEVFEHLGYPFEHDIIPKTVAYYDGRSSHGSTLSRVVHAWVLARSDRTSSMRCLLEALRSDVSDIQQGTTAEGVHLGAMAGTVDLVQRVSTGVEVTGGVLRLNPRLPEGIERLDLRIRYREHSLDLRLTRDRLTVHGREPGAAPIQLAFKDKVYEFAGGSTQVFEIARADTRLS
jgi:beta-phosphoglucomutase family hydrolase